MHYTSDFNQEIRIETNGTYIINTRSSLDLIDAFRYRTLFGDFQYYFKRVKRIRYRLVPRRNIHNGIRRRSNVA